MLYGWVLYVSVMIYPPGPAPYYHQPQEVNVSLDYLTAEECYKAKSRLWEKVLANRDILRGGWITDAYCKRVDVEPKSK